MAKPLLDRVRAAVEKGTALAESVMPATAKFYEDGNSTPVITTPARVKKPRPSTFDASDETRWGTKRNLIVLVPIDKHDDILPEGASTSLIRAGLICQIETTDGDPKINQINFTVQSTLGSNLAAERQVNVSTEAKQTPRLS